MIRDYLFREFQIYTFQQKSLILLLIFQDSIHSFTLCSVSTTVLLLL